jgi:hypothetical protein
MVWRLEKHMLIEFNPCILLTTRDRFLRLKKDITKRRLFCVHLVVISLNYGAITRAKVISKIGSLVSKQE